MLYGACPGKPYVAQLLPLSSSDKGLLRKFLSVFALFQSFAPNRVSVKAAGSFSFHSDKIRWYNDTWNLHKCRGDAVAAAEAGGDGE